jgi:GGDEF domain-containing protein
MAAAPKTGWQTGSERLQWYRGGGHLLALVVASLIFLVLDERRRVARMALRDQLTGLPNRHAFKTLLRQRLLKAERDGESFALLYIDLDGFKAVNDHHGHGRGDAVLTTLASAWPPR